ncbi:hypothetical protein RIF29_14663 [Crotalaria pallida]|uniref:Uncharacterized protein n=1 Tax=Crotalaria pallida TaxID=3830 RepID=A0AAN9IBV3_CROPI
MAALSTAHLRRHSQRLTHCDARPLPLVLLLPPVLLVVLEPCSNEKLFEIPVSYERMFPYGRCFCLRLSLRNANLQAKVHMRKAAQEEVMFLNANLLYATFYMIGFYTQLVSVIGIRITSWHLKI